MIDDIVTPPKEVQAENPPEYEAGSLLWRMQFAYNNPHREHLLMEAAHEIEHLRAERIRWERIAHDLHRRVDVYGEVCICDDYEQDWCGIHAYDDEIKGLKERGKA